MAFNWFFTQEMVDQKTPSRADGIPQTVEVRYRKEGAKLVINAANTLKLRYDTVATGVVFYHRFFMMQSFKEFNRWVVAAACLLLAGKVEETPKQCKVILKVTRSLLTDPQWAGFGANPKEELLTHERILLQTIKFDLQVEHPYSFILKFAKELKGAGDKAEIEKIVQAAWTFVNDSLVTTLSIQWEPRSVAVAFIYLAAKLSKYDLQSKYGSKSRSWWRQFVDTLDSHDLDSICHQVLDSYQDTGKDTSDDQQSDEEASSQSSKSSQLFTTPTPPPTRPNGQASTITTPTTTPSTQPPPTTWAANIVGQMAQPTVPTNAQYLQTQTQTSYQSQAGVGMTTFTLANPLQALQNIRAASTVQPQQTQYTTTQQLLYGATTLQNPSQTVIPRMVQPGAQLAGGVYQQTQYAATQPGYQSQVKVQQPYAQLGQTTVVQQPVGQAYSTPTGQVVYPSLVPGAGGVPSQQTGGLNNNLGRNAFNSPYHQSTLPQGTKTQLPTMIPQQQLLQNTSYTNYATPTGSYLTPGLVHGQTGSTQPMAATQVGGATNQLIVARTGTSTGYPSQTGVRGTLGHTPSPGKPGSGGWGMR